MQTEPAPEIHASGFVASVTRPRFSFADLFLFTLLFAAVLVALEWRYEGKMAQVAAAAFRSPLPVALIVPKRPIPASDRGAYQHDYDFRSDWFTSNIPWWDTVLEPFKGRPGVNYLEVGLYEGRSALWMLENILTHPTAHLTGIDIFEGPLKDRCLENLRRLGAADKVTTIIEPSQVALRRLPLESFDIIYIDGSHAVNDVLEDAVLSFRLLKPGGILIFDDYRWVGALGAGAGTKDMPLDFPKIAIDRFVQCFDKDLEVIHHTEASNQLILRKRKVPDERTQEG